jgi:hypothetical protein
VGCTAAVAFTRWVAGRPGACRDLGELLELAAVRECLQLPPRGAQLGHAAAGAGEPGAELRAQAASAAAAQGSGGSGCAPADPPAAPASASAPRRPPAGKLALVFGREELGLSDEELAACGLSCAIPIGRLQESLSLSHAVTVALSQLFQARQKECGCDH